jgi:hypothetical protein
MMAPTKERPKTVSELIDRIEQIREELLEIQQSLEKKESASGGSKKGSK